MEFTSAYTYINTATDNADKICKIDAVISALLDTALKSAANDNITEYSLDDGQTKIKTVYNGTEAIYKSIEAFERLKQLYVNNVNGRVTRLVDSKSFNGRPY